MLYGPMIPIIEQFYALCMKDGHNTHYGQILLLMN